jgi:P pilus assembly chaperone PapD
MVDFVLQRSFLEAFVVIGVAVTVIGIYWRIILIGGAALAFFVIVANHTSEAEVKPTVQVAQVVQEKQEVVKEVIISPPVKQIDPRRDEYVRDCVGYGFSKQWCKDNWDDKLEKEE